MAGFAEALRALPLAGAAIGAIGALALTLSRALGLSPLVAAALGVAALVLVTGGLHEDGLADVADGFGGGATRERKLEIMRDSRLGSYGGIGARSFAPAARLRAGGARRAFDWPLAAAAMIATGAASRAAGLAPLLMLAPARAGGPGRRDAPPVFRGAHASRGACGAPVACPGALWRGAGSGLAAALAAGLAAILVARLADRQIGGYTGDVLGAAQQAAEIAGLLALSAR